MAKPNPNRIELLEFINQATSELNTQSPKIEDLSTGVQYLHLLHQTHPHVVKMSKVNLKAVQEYECIANVRLLASYLAQIKAPFNCDVQKIAQRNYQENLNLLRNLYKFHYLSLQQKNNSKDHNHRDSSVSLESNLDFKRNANQKKPTPKIIIRPPQNPVLKPPTKKHPVSEPILEDYMKDAKKHAQQIKSIMGIVKGQEPEPTEKEIAAQQKLKKIIKILGINPPPSSVKKDSKIQLKTNTNSSDQNERRQSTVESIELESNTKNEKSKPTTEVKKSLEKIEEKTQNPEQQKKSKKTFDFNEIKQNALKKYVNPPSQRSGHRQTRMSTRNLMSNEDDLQFSDLLLSPEFREEKKPNPSQQKEERKPNGSVRKSALVRRSVSQDGISQERSQRKSQKKVRWEGQKSSEKKIVSSEKKQLSSVKEKEESERLTSAMKPSDRILRSSSKEMDNSGDTMDVIQDLQ